MFKKIAGFTQVSLVQIVLILGLFISIKTANSQEIAVGNANATVLSNIVVTAVGALNFGEVFQGIPKSIANNTANAAIFTITGQSGSGIEILIQLPEYLALSDGSDRLPIAFRATDVSIDTTGAADPTTMNASRGWQNTNPYAPPAGTVIGSAGTNIYLGGKVNPSINQKAGNYSGDIVMTISYNGS